MIITDTHTHLYSDAFSEDRELLIKQAIQAGISRFFIPAIDSSYTQSMFALEALFPKNVFLMTGLHPTSVQDNYQEELVHVEKQLAKRKFWAIGEIGIDLYWDKSTLALQQKAFAHQIRLAKKHQLPIVIHCRESFDQIFEILETEKGADLRGIFHCFTGTKTQAERAISFNMKLGIGGVITFKNGKLDQFLKEIDLKHLVLETDAPYLSPVPFRGKRNIPIYILKVLEKLSLIYNLPKETIAATTTQNAKEVFGI